MTETPSPEKPAESEAPVHACVALRALSDQFRSSISGIMVVGGLILLAWLLLSWVGWIGAVPQGLRWAVIGFGVYWFLFMGVRALLLDYLTAQSILKSQRLSDSVVLFSTLAQMALKGAAQAAEDAAAPPSTPASNVSYLHDLLRKPKDDN